jgi:AhpD family alkylhydroperoxidase
MTKLKQFNRRIYNRPAALFKDAAEIMRHRKQIKHLMDGGVISETFRERVMLTVTEVNGCRYCQYAHAKMALKSGLTKEEIDSLSTGAFHDCPSEEVPALLYAQHWAESKGNPDNDVRQKVFETYGESKTQLLELAMKMIQMGNLLGNTWDFFLYKISFGQLGN